MPNPLIALKKARTLIGKNGKIIIDLPNIVSYSAKLFNNNFAGFDIPRHLFHFTPETMEKILWRAGLKIENISYWSREHSAANIFYSLVNFVFGQKTFTTLVIEEKNNNLGKGGKIYFKIIRFISRLLVNFFYPIAFLESKLRAGSNMTIIASPRSELKMADVSIGVPAYNEEKDIAKVVGAIQGQITNPGVSIREIIIIDGNSTDNTRKIVREIMKRDSRVKLMTQKRRRGKIDAINIFIEAAKEEILIMANSDNIPDQYCLQAVINPLVDKRVGLSGPQMICLNSGNGFFVYINNLIWRLHHKISIIKPKMSSFVAFRKKQVQQIPLSAVIDEPALEAIVENLGKKIVYCPEAKVYIKGAETFDDFCRQRRRNHVGYINLQRMFPQYHPPTFRTKMLFRAMLSEISFDVVDNFYLILSILLEAYCKILALYDFYFKKKNYQAWPMIKTSKGLKLNQNEETP